MEVDQTVAPTTFSGESDFDWVWCIQHKHSTVENIVLLLSLELCSLGLGWALCMPMGQSFEHAMVFSCSPQPAQRQRVSCLSHWHKNMFETFAYEVLFIKCITLQCIFALIIMANVLWLLCLLSGKIWLFLSDLLSTKYRDTSVC